ncbi:MAG: hypothetical protein ACHQQP_02395, partial [Gemmatimonadales bacterium]
PAMVCIMHRASWPHQTLSDNGGSQMHLKLQPQISRVRRQSAVEQTSDLLKAYLEHWADPFATSAQSDEMDEHFAALSMGFILPQRKSA